MTPEQIIKAAIDEVTKKFMDEGRIIEAGWQSMKLVAIPPTAPDIQLREMRKAFFCGAQHLFASILGCLEADDEPTETDMKRMDLVHRELGEFIKEIKESCMQ